VLQLRKCGIEKVILAGMPAQDWSSLLDACEDPPMESGSRDALERFIADRWRAVGHDGDDPSA